MDAKLLLIDPQNDFCDIEGAALPVPGAHADMQRLADFIQSAQSRFREIIVTLDTHPTVAIERTSFWLTGSGAEVPAFTQITEADVREGRFQPRNERLRDEVLGYLRALEAGGRFRLMVWPIHCVLGTWGHNIHSAVAGQISAWEQNMQHEALKVLKGLNPLTEQYSAVRAEVPRADDPRTQSNRSLIERAIPGEGETLFVAGEAASHCVAETMAHLFEAMAPEEIRRVIILRDCMSPVAGFEAAAEAFFAKAQKLGARAVTHTETMKQ
jgi:nicotinamidase/pyrazinamidase